MSEKYTPKDIKQFLVAANSDLGLNKYKGDEMIPDYCKAVLIGFQLQAELDKHRWIPLTGELPETEERLELLTHRGWVDCGVVDAYGKGFNTGTGKVYMPASYYTHYRPIILPEGE